MEFLAQQLTPLAAATGVPLQGWLVAVLFLIGVLGQLLIRVLIRRLTGLARHTDTHWDDVVVYALTPPAEWVMWLVLMYLSLGVFDRLEGLRDTLVQAADTGAIMLGGWFVHRLLCGVETELLAEHRGPRDSNDRATISATARLARITLWILAGLMILQSLGVSISGLLAFGGVGGIAVGFAARDLLANFLGSLSIYLDRPFAAGDWIRSPDRQIEGTVEHVGWRMTRIRTFDARPLYVPNAMFSTVAIENPSRMLNRRIFETFGIRYQDAAQMGSIVAAVRTLLEGHEAIDQGRIIIVNFVSCGPSSLDFFVYTFTKTTDWATFHGVKQDVMLKILGIIADHGAEVAFPTQTLHVEGVASGPAPLLPEPTP